MADNHWCVYIIESTDGLLYTGITTDLERRYREHSGLEGAGKAAKFFRGRKPKAIRFRELHKDRSTASRREAEIKKMTVRAKRELIDKAGF